MEIEIEIGLGRFEAFTIIGRRHDSSVHDSVAGALGWLNGRFIASVMSTEVEVPGCTAAIFDADVADGSDSPPLRVRTRPLQRVAGGPVRCRSWIAVRCASNAG